MIFKNIKDEYDLSRTKQKHAESQAAGSRSQEKNSTKSRGGKAWVGWTLGTLATIGAGGAVLYFHLSQQEAPPGRNRNLVK